MRCSISVTAITLVSMTLAATNAKADVVVRGPFGGRVVVTSPPDVIVVPSGVVVTPQPPLPPPPPSPPPPIVVPSPPPPPIVMTNAILPQDFVKTFQPRAGTYRVVFIHPRTGQPVTVAFDLPPGNPQVSYFAHTLVFDYGLHEVTIRFQVLGKVKVIQR